MIQVVKNTLHFRANNCLEIIHSFPNLNKNSILHPPLKTMKLKILEPLEIYEHHHFLKDQTSVNFAVLLTIG